MKSIFRYHYLTINIAFLSSHGMPILQWIEDGVKRHAIV